MIVFSAKFYCLGLEATPWENNMLVFPPGRGETFWPYIQFAGGSWEKTKKTESWRDGHLNHCVMPKSTRVSTICGNSPYTRVGSNRWHILLGHIWWVSCQFLGTKYSLSQDHSFWLLLCNFGGHIPLQSDWEYILDSWRDILNTRSFCTCCTLFDSNRGRDQQALCQKL